MNITYPDWAAYHGTAFGLTRPDDLDMFAIWINVFERSRFTVSELTEATDFMLTKSAPKFRSDHLMAIQQRIAEGRATTARMNAELQQTRNQSRRCVECDDTGLVIVPHPRFVSGGEWLAPWPTCGVACACSLGLRVTGMMTLMQYEFVAMDWKQMVADRNALKASFVEAHNHARSVDSVFGAAIGKIMNRIPKTPNE